MIMKKANKLSFPLFCYGTLRASIVMKAVTGHVYQGRTAKLHDYAIFRVRGTEYPAIIPQKGSIVPGTLYEGVDEQSLLVLDDFEGEHYSRIIVAVETDQNTPVRAFVYCLRETFTNCLSNESWNIDTFLSREIDSFMGSFIEERKRGAKRSCQASQSKETF